MFHKIFHKNWIINEDFKFSGMRILVAICIVRAWFFGFITIELFRPCDLPVEMAMRRKKIWHIICFDSFVIFSFLDI